MNLLRISWDDYKSLTEDRIAKANVEKQYDEEKRDVVLMLSDDQFRALERAYDTGSPLECNSLLGRYHYKLFKYLKNYKEVIPV